MIDPKSLVYIGSGAGKILVLALDTKTGQLSAFSEQSAGKCPSFLAFTPEGHSLFAIDEDNSEVTSFRVGTTGELKPLNTVGSGGIGPAYISVSNCGRWVLVANYGGGSVASLPILSDGKLGDACSIQTPGKNPHAILQAPDSDRVLVPALGEDTIFQYRLNAETGELSPIPSSSVALSRGAGPRHLRFHPKDSSAYVVHEHTSQVTKFDVSQGGLLNAAQTLSTLPAAFPAKSNTGADIHLSPCGRFLYTSNRGHDSIAIFQVSKGGNLTPLGHAPIGGRTPRNFSLTRQGDLLLVGNLRSDSVSVFRVNDADGMLDLLHVNENIPSPFWVRQFGVN